MTNENIKTYIKNNLQLAEPCDYIVNYTHCNSQYIDDIIAEIADSATDVYYSNLIDWLKKDPESVDYIESAVDEFGQPEKFDFMKLLQQGQYYQNEQTLYKNKSDMCLLWALIYCLENNIDLTDAQIENLSDDIDNNVEKFDDIITKIDKIKNS